jgi:hypothetical protein
MSKKEMISKLRDKLSEPECECKGKGQGCVKCSDKEDMEHEKSEAKSGGMKDMLSKLKPSIVKVAVIKSKKV